jgi:coenzyme F420-0:L-glutamate ligase
VPDRLEVLALHGIGEVRPGDDLVGLIAAAGAATLRDDDVVVVTSKVVSKAEGRLVDVPADPAGREAARQAAIDAEAVRVVARRGATRIVQTRHGLVLAAAGVDASNVDPSRLVLLPEDPDASARALRAGLADRLGVRVAVVVTDTMGRTWRTGQTDVAIGAAGLAPLRDHRGQTDPYGNDLEVTAVAVIDELAAAADLVKGKTSGVPVAIVRGLGPLPVADGPGAATLVRAAEDDMFALGTAEARAAGRLDVLTALRSGSGLAARPVPAGEMRHAVALVLGTVSHPRRWRFVHVASEAARETLAGVRGLPWLRHAPAVLAVLHPAVDQDTDGTATLRAPFAATGLVLTDVTLRSGDAGRIHDALDVPAGWRLAALYAVGYPADPAHPVEHDTTDAWVTR